MTTEIKSPATCVAHWASGPVPCCEMHARALVGLGAFLGCHVPLTALTEPAECTNCVNEAKAEPESTAPLEPRKAWSPLMCECNGFGPTCSYCRGHGVP